MRKHSTGRLAITLAGLGLALAACGGTADDTAGSSSDAPGDSMNMCIEGVEDCEDTTTNGIAEGEPNGGDSAADCEAGVECNDTGGDGASSACLAGSPDCNDTPADDCPTCDPDAQGVSDERMQAVDDNA